MNRSRSACRKKHQRTFLICDTPLSIPDFLRTIRAERDTYDMSAKVKGYRLVDVPAAFDIETSSWYEGMDKRACMYVWQFGTNGHVTMGRTWEEFTGLIDCMQALFGLGDELRLAVYVHNLAYEFQFLRKWFAWKEVFALKSRTPVYAETTAGVIFKCSYILSGYSLEKLADQLMTYKVRKMSGDLDYSLIRHSGTPLTAKEVRYCIYDVLVVMAYIQEKIEQDGDLSRIPSTKTGYVRRYCRKQCFDKNGKKKNKGFAGLNYFTLIKHLTMTPEVYRMLKRAFSGGFTHASAFYSGLTVCRAGSHDFTSSYPYVMVSEQYPMSRAMYTRIESKEQLERYLKKYCCLFDLELWDVEDTFLYDHYISLSHCFEKEQVRTDNGRIVTAGRIKLTVTEQDYMIIRKTYKWSHARITNFYRFTKAYLPTPFIKSILKLYADKTTLKGVSGKEVEYLASKEMVNAAYGMTVMDPVRDKNIYEGNEWKETITGNVEESLQRYNTGHGRFLYYPWGVWVTAYARRNLWTGILEYAEDYVYSDTDSIKGLHTDRHKKYIEDYNRAVRVKLQHACEYHGIDIALTEPETIKGVKKPLGVWDYEGEYIRFKTLGAKRYMTESGDGINITVSGLNKKVTVPWIAEGWKADRITKKESCSPFDRFSDRLQVPAPYTGKQTHTYIDEETCGTVTDYTGRRGTYHERSSIHMEGAEYTLGLAQEYIDYILDVQDID